MCRKLHVTHTASLAHAGTHRDSSFLPKPVLVDVLVNRRMPSKNSPAPILGTVKQETGDPHERTNEKGSSFGVAPPPRRVLMNEKNLLTKTGGFSARQSSDQKSALEKSIDKLRHKQKKDTGERVHKIILQNRRLIKNIKNTPSKILRKPPEYLASVPVRNTEKSIPDTNTDSRSPVKEINSVSSSSYLSSSRESSKCDDKMIEKTVPSSFGDGSQSVDDTASKRKSSNVTDEFFTVKKSRKSLEKENVAKQSSISTNNSPITELSVHSDVINLETGETKNEPNCSLAEDWDDDDEEEDSDYIHSLSVCDKADSPSKAEKNPKQMDSIEEQGISNYSSGCHQPSSFESESPKPSHKSANVTEKPFSDDEKKVEQLSKVEMKPEKVTSMPVRCQPPRKGSVERATSLVKAYKYKSHFSHFIEKRASSVILDRRKSDLENQDVDLQVRPQSSNGYDSPSNCSNNSFLGFTIDKPSTSKAVNEVKLFDCGSLAEGSDHEEAVAVCQTIDLSPEVELQEATTLDEPVKDCVMKTASTLGLFDTGFDDEDCAFSQQDTEGEFSIRSVGGIGSSGSGKTQPSKDRECFPR